MKLVPAFVDLEKTTHVEALNSLSNGTKFILHSFSFSTISPIEKLTYNI